MTVVDADKFLSYLIFSKHIDGLTCKEVKEAIEMCKVDVLDKIRAEIEERIQVNQCLNIDRANALCWCLQIIDKYRNEVSE